MIPVLRISQKWNPTNCGLSGLLLSLSGVLRPSRLPPVSHRGVDRSLACLQPPALASVGHPCGRVLSAPGGAGGVLLGQG